MQPKPSMKTLQKALVKANQDMIQQCQNPQNILSNEEWIGDLYYTLRRIELCIDEMYAVSQQSQTNPSN